MGYFKFGSDGKDVNTLLENNFVSDRSIINQHVGGELGILGDDTIYQYGFLGNNSTNPNTYFSETTPKGINWNKARIAGATVLATKTDGTLWSWGTNTYGQLGIGSVASKSTPVQVGALTTWKSVSVGVGTCAAIKTDGTLWMWGDNTMGVLSDGTTVHKSSPIQLASGGNNWKKVVATYQTIIASKTDGTLWAWSGYYSSFLGTGSQSLSTTPVQIVGTWKDFDAGYSHVAGIKSDGTLWSWGQNGYGQLGNGTASGLFGASTPVQTVAGGNNWKQVVLGNNYTVALKNNGTLWAWGQNNFNQLNDGTYTSKSSPIQVIGATPWVEIYDCEPLSQFTLAKQQNRSIYYWGNATGTGLAADTGGGVRLTAVGVEDSDSIIDMSSYASGITRIAVPQT